ncbi:MAG: hypothetical protein AAGG44_18390, partial [Planctomycetota bacterium]
GKTLLFEGDRDGLLTLAANSWLLWRDSCLFGEFRERRCSKIGRLHLCLYPALHPQRPTPRLSSGCSSVCPGPKQHR